MTELAYIIDKKESEVNQALVIKIIEITTKDFQLHPVTPQRPLTQSLLLQLSKEIDREAINLLIQEEKRFLNISGKVANGNTLFNQIRIRYGQSVPVIKLIAATGKLYFKEKSLIADFFGKVDLFLHLEALPENKVLISGELKTTRETFSIKECDFLCPGPPHWFIKGISFRLIKSDISWKILKKVYEADPWILNQQQKQQFLNECEELDKDQKPHIIFIENGLENCLQKGLEPHPLLMLKDRTGAFADLWIDYGEGYTISYSDPSNQIVHPQTRQILTRHKQAEECLEKDLLETHFIKKIVGSSHYYCPLDKVTKSLTFLLEVGWQIIDYQNKQVIRQTKLLLDAHDKGHAVIVKGKVHYQSFEADITAVVGAFNRKERFISLSEGTVGLLPDTWENKDLTLLIEEGLATAEGIKLNKNNLGTLEDLWNSTEVIELDERLQQLKNEMTRCKDKEIFLPGPSFQGDLRPYQQEGLNWLKFLYDNGFHGLLADDMGLGKTVQVLAFLSLIPRSSPILIILPTSLIFNWKNEIDRFLNNEIVYLLHGPNRLQELTHLDKNAIILTSYSILRQDLPLLKQIDYQCIILDEAQNIKNFHTQTAQAACSLRSRFKLSITGTPVENHLNELWSHFRFLIPDLFPDEKAFAAEAQASLSDYRYLDKIRRRMRPFFLRRTKEEVAKDLPERIEQVMMVEMLPTQRQLYDEFLAGIKKNLLHKIALDGVTKHRMEIFEAILRLRQICCHPLLISSMLSEEAEIHSAKMDMLLQDTATVMQEGKKVLIYSQFTSMLQLLAKTFRERNWPFVYLDGNTTDREEAVKQFQEDPTLSCFLISLKAGGVGLNLTAADYVFLYDPWWNEAVENQAINRAHRIGRNRTVIAKRYVCAESIEEKIMKLKHAKRTLAEGLFDTTDSSLPIDENVFFLFD